MESLYSVRFVSTLKGNFNDVSKTTVHNQVNRLRRAYHVLICNPCICNSDHMCASGALYQVQALAH